MPRSLEALLTEVIDYAGLFPPSQLDLAESLRVYETHRQGVNRPLVGRFVIPAHRLKDLPDNLNPSEPLALSVIGQSGPWPFARSLDAEAMNAHLDRFGDLAPIEAYELKLPEAESADEGTLQHWLADLTRFGADETYLEFPLDSSEKVGEILAALAESAPADSLGIGAKARLSPAPSPSHLAPFIQGCLQLEIPFKVTAGLHQPFPHDDPVSGLPQFGFLPIFATAALVMSEDLTLREIEEALVDPEGWKFEGKLTWRNHSADLDTVLDSRDLFRSFGCCSIEDPASALQRLKLWPF